MDNFLKNFGYSIIELLAVIVIVGIITAVALKSLRTVSDTSRAEKTKKELDQLAFAISGDPNVTSGGSRASFGYVGDVGGMPPNLEALVSNPGGYATWKGPYLRDDYLPSGGSSNTEFKVDEWGTAYNFSGNTISSTGGGTTITRKLANSVSDLIYNPVAVSITDKNLHTPGPVYKDSLRVVLTQPNGAGGITTRTRIPAQDGFVKIDSVPIGRQTVKVIYLPFNDTLTRQVIVYPGELSSIDVSLFRAVWSGAGGSGGSGPSNMVTIRPNGVGSFSELSNSGCASNWQCVDDITADEDATYVTAPGSSTFDDVYTAEDPSASGTIDSVKIYIRVKNTATNNQIVNTSLYIGGSFYLGASINLNSVSSYTNFSTKYTTNPSTSSAWQWSAINSMQIGIRMKKPARCTQIWAEIYYH